jgi:hypothetical protein
MYISSHRLLWPLAVGKHLNTGIYYYYYYYYIAIISALCFRKKDAQHNTTGRTSRHFAYTSKYRGPWINNQSRDNRSTAVSSTIILNT